MMSRSLRKGRLWLKAAVERSAGIERPWTWNEKSCDHPLCKRYALEYDRDPHRRGPDGMEGWEDDVEVCP